MSSLKFPIPKGLVVLDFPVNLKKREFKLIKELIEKFLQGYLDLYDK